MQRNVTEEERTLRLADGLNVNKKIPGIPEIPGTHLIDFGRMKG